MKNKKIKKAGFNALKSLWKMFPIILGTILLVSIINSLIPKSFYTKAFTENMLIDSFLGSAIGSVLLGNPIVSYILGGELLNNGVSLIAVTAFIVSWVTVGFIQFPAEASVLGKKFAVSRNISAFLLSILVAILTVLILNLFGISGLA